MNEKEKDYLVGVDTGSIPSFTCVTFINLLSYHRNIRGSVMRKITKWKGQSQHKKKRIFRRKNLCKK